MSNLWFNIRFGFYHFQISKDLPFLSIAYNQYQPLMKKSDPNWKWFNVYCWFGKQVF